MAEPTTDESRVLFVRARTADSDAATDLHDRYCARLIALIRTRIDQRLRSRFDAEDVVNSAFRSFFYALAQDRYSLPASGGLWPLLAQIAIHKLHRSVKYHQRHQRDAAAEQSLESTAAPVTPAANVAEVALRDELKWLAEKLSKQSYRAIELSVEGYTHEEIAIQLNCSQRSIRRYIAEARSLLRFRLGLECETPARQPTADSADSLSFDDFLLRRMVGSGAFGKVYLATNRSTGQDVAIKYLRRRWTRDHATVQRFIRETRILQSLDIPGVVPCLGGGPTNDGGRFIVMKWIEGETLAEQLSRHAMSEIQARRKFAILASTLHQVHQQGITHCDLKPTNLLIDQDSQWWVTDFGFALDDSHPQQAIAGTPRYMAPEQLNPLVGPIGPWTDLYALGLILLESLVGPNTWTEAGSHKPALARLPEVVSPSLAATVASLLEPAIQQRCHSSRELDRRLSAG